MNCGEVASNRSAAALANRVSGMRTPANDSRRVIVTITELVIACLMPSPLSADDWNESDSDTPAVRHRRPSKDSSQRVRFAEPQQSAHSLARRPQVTVAPLDGLFNGPGPVTDRAAIVRKGVQIGDPPPIPKADRHVS